MGEFVKLFLINFSFWYSLIESNEKELLVFFVLFQFFLIFFIEDVVPTPKLKEYKAVRFNRLPKVRQLQVCYGKFALLEPTFSFTFGLLLVWRTS